MNQEIQARTPSTCGSRRPSLTPLGFFAKPHFQRRLSEALLDVQNKITNSQQQKTKMKRIASELNWRPNSTPGLNLSPTDESIRIKIPHTTSCNMLEVPMGDAEMVPCESDRMRRSSSEARKHSLSTANLLLHKVFGVESSDVTGMKTVVIHTVRTYGHCGRVKEPGVGEPECQFFLLTFTDKEEKIRI